jgi:para-nitrobenzyl esterase
MRAAPRTTVLTALAQATQQVSEPAGRTFWEPSVDGVVIPGQPRTLFEAGAFERVPTIVGFSRDEGWGAFITRSFPSGVTTAQYEAWVGTEFGPLAPGVLELYASEAASSPIEAMARVVGDVQFVCEARRLARAIERSGTRTYVYAYEHEIDALSLDHVIHGVEGNILFANNYAPPQFPAYTLTADDLALHAAMAGYWTGFAATGNPNRGGRKAVSWPRYRRPAGRGRGNDRHLVLVRDIFVRSRLREHCDFFAPHVLRSVLGGLPAAAP